jgi:hypothetical protein
MNSIWRKFRLSVFVVAASLTAVMLANPAKADVVWSVNGTFQDGGTVSGTFTINVYGYLSDFDLKTTAVGPFSGFEYTPLTSYYATGTFYVDAQPGYFGDLHLQFVSNLGNPSPNNPIVGGVYGPSYECVGSWSCYVPQGGFTRYIDKGFASSGGSDAAPAVASVPETSTWAMLLIGFLGVGFIAYRRTLSGASARVA